MISCYRKFVSWLMTTRLYKHLLMHVIPYIRFTTYYTTLRGMKYHKLYKHLKPGDVILSTDRKKLTTLLIPGEFSHASMCVGVDGWNGWEISEMTHNHYTKSCFFDICKESDRVVIMRVICQPCFGEHVEQAIERCKSYEHAEYDTEFTLGVESLYCSELVFQSYKDNCLQAPLDDLAGLGKPYISPTGLYHAKNLKVIMDSDAL